MGTARKLRRHASGQWTCKIAGKSYYFGTDEADAYRRLEAEYSSIVTGERRPVGTTVRDAANAFMAAKEGQLETGEITSDTHGAYFRILKTVVAQIGSRPLDALQPPDFAKVRTALAKGRSPLTLSVVMTKAKSLFRFAYEEGLIDRPVRYGASFDRPSKSVLRRLKKNLLFTAAESRAMIENARPMLRAMIYLGLNGGLGNTDCSRLTAARISGTWLDYPRPKTGVDRRIPLWPETLGALEAAGQKEGLVFISRSGGPLSYTAIGGRFDCLLGRLEIQQPGRRFYTLRRTFATVADETKDFAAVGQVLGHIPKDTTSIYRQRISDERLLAVVEFVRDWLKNSP